MWFLGTKQRLLLEGRSVVNDQRKGGENVALVVQCSVFGGMSVANVMLLRLCEL